jgi:hypothetical protein
MVPRQISAGARFSLLRAGVHGEPYARRESRHVTTVGPPVDSRATYAEKYGQVCALGLASFKRCKTMATRPIT